MINIKEEVLSASKRIQPYIRQTPLENSPFLSDTADCNAFLKLENRQYTGSFKVRGAINKLLSLNPGQKERGVIAASTGNHGLAVAFGLSRLGMHGTIFLPENVSPQKLDRLRRHPFDIELHGVDCEATEHYARRIAEKQGRVYISPYNDPAVVGGQGTIATELLRQRDGLDAVLVSVGGGGLISGIAGYIKASGKTIEIIGCLPRNSPAMYDAVSAGHIVNSEIRPTISDGTAGGLEAGSVTFDLCKQYVDDWVLVTEEEIHGAMRMVFKAHKLVIEGAAGVSVASLLKIKKKFKGKTVAVVICGGNVDMKIFQKIVDSGL